MERWDLSKALEAALLSGCLVEDRDVSTELGLGSLPTVRLFKHALARDFLLLVLQKDRVDRLDVIRSLVLD